MAVIYAYIHLISCLLIYASTVAALCYFPDGETIAVQDTPCLSDQHSSCCGQGFACMSNGLCKLTEYVIDAGPGHSKFVRGSCSDKDWGPNCPAFCVTTQNGDTLTGAMGLAQCEGDPSDRYYCLDAAVESLTVTVSESSLASSMLCTSYSAKVFFQGSPSAVTTIGVRPATTSSSTTEVRSGEISSSETRSSETKSNETKSSETKSSQTKSSETKNSETKSNKPSSSETRSSKTDTTSHTSPSVTRSQFIEQVTPTVETTPVVEPASKSNLKVAVGVGVGVPLGVFALSLLVFILWRYQRPQKFEQQTQLAHVAHPYPTDMEGLSPKQDVWEPQTPAQSSAPVEIGWHPTSLHELPGHSNST